MQMGKKEKREGEYPIFFVTDLIKAKVDKVEYCPTEELPTI